MKSRILAAFLVGLGFAMSGFFIASGLTSSREYNRFVEVKGLAEKVVKANEAVWTINVKLVNNDLTALYQEITDTQNKAKQFLLKQGFKEQEISTNSVAVTDTQSVAYNQNTNIPRYSADTGLTITTKNVDQVASSLQKTGELVQQGIVVTASSAYYRYNNLNSLKPAMLDEATQNAREAAQSFAKNTNASLGDIRKANQGLFTITDANSNYDSGNTIMKKIRIVTTVDYQLK